MFCDGVADLDAAERARYADLLVLIAAADGELVREEIQVLEGFMGRAWSTQKQELRFEKDCLIPIDFQIC